MWMRNVMSKKLRWLAAGAIFTLLAATWHCKGSSPTSPTEVKKGVPEWIVTLTFTTNPPNDPKGKYYAKSVFAWKEKGGVYGISVISMFMRYLNENGIEFFSQSWTADSIKNAWGGSNHINAGQSKDYDVNYHFNNPVVTRLTIEYRSTVRDDLGNETELVETRSAQLSL